MTISDLPWTDITGALSAHGHATTGPLLDVETCRRIAGWYEEEARFRSRVVMERHAYGKGEYKYFAYPLPEEIATEVSIFTRAGVTRIMRFAFKLAQSRPRKLLTVVTKSNAQRHGMVLWDEIAAEVA